MKVLPNVYVEWSNNKMAKSLASSIQGTLEESGKISGEAKHFRDTKRRNSGLGGPGGKYDYKKDKRR